MLAKEVKEILSITQSELNTLVKLGLIRTTSISKTTKQGSISFTSSLDYNNIDVMNIKKNGYKAFITNQAKTMHSNSNGYTYDSSGVAHDRSGKRVYSGHCEVTKNDRPSCHQSGCHPYKRPSSGHC